MARSSAMAGDRSLEEPDPGTNFEPSGTARIGTAYTAAHILPVPLAKPGDSGPTRITGRRAFHQRWARPVVARPHGSLTGAGESHASVLAISPYLEPVDPA